MMRLKKIKLCFLFSVFFLSGCYNYHELSELSITTAIGIDKSENGYKLIAQVMNIQKKNSDASSGGNTPEVIIYENEDKSLLNALRHIVLQAPKKLYPSHLDILLISEDVAKEGLEDIFEFFFRDPNVRMQFNVLIAKGTTSEEVLETLTPGQAVSSKNIVDSQETDAKYLGTSQLITFEDLMDMYLNPNKEIIIPAAILNTKTSENNSIENIEKANDNTKIILDSTGVFKDSKLIGYINNEESIYLNYIKGEVLGTLIICECDKGNYLTSEVKNIKSTANFDKKEKKIVIEVSGDGNINEMNCYIDVEKGSGIEKIEKLVNDEVEKNINKFIRNSISKYNSDFFSFLDIIYKSDYTYYKTIKDNWYESGLKNLKFEVKSKIKITKKGNVLRDIYDK